MGFEPMRCRHLAVFKINSRVVLTCGEGGIEHEINESQASLVTPTNQPLLHDVAREWHERQLVTGLVAPGPRAHLCADGEGCDADGIE